MRSPMVFVTQQPAFFKHGVGWTPKFDLAPAEKFGKLHYLCGPGNLFRDQFNTQVAHIRDTLRSFEYTSADYIFPLGDPVLIATVCMIASEMSAGHVRLLKWHRLSNRAESFDVSVA